VKHIQLFEDFALQEGYFDLEDKDYILYHATPTHNIPKIKKEGIHLSEPSGKPFSKGLVWLGGTEEAARKHAASRMKKKNIIDDISVIVLKMNPKKDNLTKALTTGVFTSAEVIPPSKIVKIIV